MSQERTVKQVIKSDAYDVFVMIVVILEMLKWKSVTNLIFLAHFPQFLEVIINLLFVKWDQIHVSKTVFLKQLEGVKRKWSFFVRVCSKVQP